MENEAKSRFNQGELVLLAILFAASVVVGTGIQMGSALFPSLSRLMGVPVSTVTLLTSVWAFTGLLSPLFGPLSDRYGHTLFVLIGLGAFVLGSLLCVAAPSFSILVGFQVLVGLGYAIFSFSVSSVVGDAFAYGRRARAMGIVRLSVSMAALVGVPVAATIAGRATARGSFGTVGGLGLIVLAVGLLLFRSLSRSVREEQHRAGARANPWRMAVEVVRQRSVVAGLLVVLIGAAIPTGTFIYLAAWLEQTFQLVEREIGLVFAAIGVGAVIGNALTAIWADRLGKKRSSALGLLVLSVTAVLLSRLPVLAATVVGLIVFTAALEFGFAAFVTLLTELVPGERGTLMSLVSLANGIGTGLVPVVMRPLSESGGYATITLALGAGGLGAVAIVSFLVVERRAPDLV
jgi:predicted MFS family arabinose efflux permease